MASVPIFQALSVDVDVLAALGAPPRVYGWGQAPEGVARPYLVWQVVTGSPGNNLSDRPDFDQRNIQIDIYGDTSQSVEAAALAVRDALEAHVHITGWHGEGRDEPTDLYRFTFAVDWFVSR